MDGSPPFGSVSVLANEMGHFDSLIVSKISLLRNVRCLVG